MIRRRRLTEALLEELARTRGAGGQPDPALTARVREILESVRTQGDEVVRGWNRDLDGWEGPIEVSETDRQRSRDAVPKQLESSLQFAADRIRDFHAAQVPREILHALRGGSLIELRFQPLARVGIYAPGGRAPYPSTVLMAGLCARSAGVPDLVLATPARPRAPGGLDPTVALAAEIAGIERIFLIGGAVAVAALAYGTETVPRVDKIVGPGNRFVTEAKRALFGEVGLDGLPGPSESLLVVDRNARLDWTAREALTQVEHGPDSFASIVTVGDRVSQDLSAELEELTRGLSIPDRSSVDRIELVEADDAAAAWRFADVLAPESLYVDLTDLEPWRARPPRCGALFLGPWSSVAFGDYVSGTNHILPTGGAARFQGGLAVSDLGRWVSIQQLTRTDAAELAAPGAALAIAEGMPWHAEAQRIRSPVGSRSGGIERV
jgi:histidinol dehydrogenase